MSRVIGLHGWALLSLLDSASVSIYRETQRSYGLSKHGILCSHGRADNGSGAVADKPLNESSRWRALRETKEVLLYVEGLWAATRSCASGLGCAGAGLAW